MPHLLSETLVWCVTLLLFGMGLIGTLIPMLPGIIIIAAGCVWQGAMGRENLAWWEWTVLALLVAGGMVIDKLSGGMGAKKIRQHCRRHLGSHHRRRGGEPPFLPHRRPFVHAVPGGAAGGTYLCQKGYHGRLQGRFRSGAWDACRPAAGIYLRPAHHRLVLFLLFPVLMSKKL